MTAGDARLDAIQARLDAATPGPWYWRNTQHVYLMGARSRAVMGFTRMGMQGAQPQFVNSDGLFIDAGKENLHAIPDAEFIANAPADVAFLLAELREARQALTRVGRVTDGISAHSEGRGLDYSDDDFDRGWHGAVRAVVDQIRAAVAAANGDGEDA